MAHPAQQNPEAVLQIAARHRRIQFINGDDTIGCCAYPINYDELYNLKGRLLTIIDATFTDVEQRKAHKDIVWNTLRTWMDDIERAADVEPLPPH